MMLTTDSRRFIIAKQKLKMRVITRKNQQYGFVHKLCTSKTGGCPIEIVLFDGFGGKPIYGPMNLEVVRVI